MWPSCQGLYQHEMDFLDGLSHLTAAAPAAVGPGAAAHDIEASVERLIQKEQERRRRRTPAPERRTRCLYDELQEKDGGLYAQQAGPRAVPSEENEDDVVEAEPPPH